MKVDWTDGATVTVVIGMRGAGFTRIVSARLDLADDRSFLADRHRDLVETLPNLSIHPGQPPNQGWISVGVGGGGATELHVLLQPLAASVDLILGRCAVEILSAS